MEYFQRLPGPGAGPGIAPAKPGPAPPGPGPKKKSRGHSPAGAGAKKKSRGHGPAGAGAKIISRGAGPAGAGAKILSRGAGPAGAGAETISRGMVPAAPATPVASTSKLAKVWCITHQKDLKSVVIFLARSFIPLRWDTYMSPKGSPLSLFEFYIFPLKTFLDFNLQAIFFFCPYLIKWEGGIYDRSL